MGTFPTVGMQDSIVGISNLTVVTAAPTKDLLLLADFKDDWQIAGTSDDAFLARAIRRCSAEVAQFCNRDFGLATYKEVIRIGRDTAPFVIPNGVVPLQLARWPVQSVTSVVEGFSDPTTLDSATDYDVVSVLGQLSRLDSNGMQREWNAGVITVTYAAGYVLPYVYEARTLAFTATSITDTANGLATFRVGTTVDVVDSTANSGTYVVATSAAGELTFVTSAGAPVAFTPHAKGPVVTLTVEPTLPDDIQDAVSRMVWTRYAERGRDPFVKSETTDGLGSVTYISPNTNGNLSDDIADILDNYRVPVVA